MKRRVTLTGVVLATAVLLTLTGCERVADIFGSLTRTLVDIRIDDQRIGIGENVDLVVTGIYSDDFEEVITSGLSWESNDGTVATVTAGTVTGVSPGSAIVSVTHEGRRATFSDTAVVTVLSPPLVVDDFESDSSASWVVINDAAGSGVSVFERSTEQAFGGTRSLKITFSVATSGTNPWGIAGLRTLTGGPLDLTDYFSISVKVHPNGTTSNVILVIQDSDGTQLSSVLAPTPAPVSGNEWMTVEYAFDDLGVATWAPDGDLVFNWEQVEMVQFVLDEGAGTIYIDDVLIQ